MQVVFELASIVIAQTPVEPSAAPSATQIQSMWDLLIKGGPMMIPIGICSLVVLTVVVERLVSLRRSAVIPPNFLTGLRSAMSGSNDGRQAMEYCKARPSPVASVFAAGLRRSHESSEVMERHIQEAGEREALKLRKHLRIVAVIASVAPLLGLLGTITGMIKAFQTVAASAEALGKTEMLATGIYEAMITTAAGLIVAIPAMVCYHWLTARIDRLVMDIDHMTVEFVEDLTHAPTARVDPARNGESSHKTPPKREPQEHVAAPVAAAS